MLRTVHFMEASVVDILFVIAMLGSSETQGQIKGARESLNGWKNIYGTKKSKERREEPLGTMSYQTSSKRSPPFWLLIGARKIQVFKFPFFTFLRAIFFRPFRLSLVPTISPRVSEDAMLGNVFKADLARERELHLTTVKRVERTNLDFRCPICHTAIGQASYLVCARPALSTDVPVLLLNQPVTPALSVKLMRAFSSTSLWQRM